MGDFQINLLIHDHLNVTPEAKLKLSARQEELNSAYFNFPPANKVNLQSEHPYTLSQSFRIIRRTAFVSGTENRLKLKIIKKKEHFLPHRLKLHNNVFYSMQNNNRPRSCSIS